MVRSRLTIAALLGSVFLVLAFCLGLKPNDRLTSAGGTQRSKCAPGNAGLAVPPGFCVQIFADRVGRARHITVGKNGDVFVALATSRDEDDPTGVLALRDIDGDGQADIQRRFGDTGGTGIALHGDHLYFAPDDAVLRYPMRTGSLEPVGPPDTILAGLPADRSHRAKSIAIARDGSLYVNIGAPSNACQVQSRTPGSPGQDPCPELETRGGIWRFDGNRTGQTQADGQRFATGLRTVVALTLHPLSGGLFGAVHGRDRLNTLWPELFDERQNAEKPSEELVLIEAGDDFGWPYCYHDPEIRLLVLAPEYGGDGLERGRCTEKKEPIVAFPAHWAPNALLFYSGTQFPSHYRLGAFVAFHGSWNRAPLPQGGYNVVFVPFAGDRPAAEWEVFADGFAGADRSPRGAAHRPSGLAQGPNGSLFVTDDRSGRIYKISYVEGGTD
jgi:glucose/arabinose dehydrogenase